MTEDEQRQITTEVLQEHKNARTRFGCLRSRARRMARVLRENSDALDGRSQGDVKGLTARMPSATDVASILEEIKATEREITVLENEMNSQGFGEYIPVGSGQIVPAEDDD